MARAAVAEGGAASRGGGGPPPKTGCAAVLEVGSSCSSAPEGAMLPFAPPEEPWDEDMEVFGGSATSGEVSVVANGDWSRPLFPPDPGRGCRRKGRGPTLGSGVPRQAPWRLQGGGTSTAPSVLSFRPGRDYRAGSGVGRECLPRRLRRS